MSEWLIEFGQWFRQYQYGCAMAIIATILVIFGNEINAAVRQLVRKQHFFCQNLSVCLVMYTWLWRCHCLADEIIV